MAKENFYLKKGKDSCVLGNRVMEAAFSKKCGNLINLTLKRKKFGTWNGWDGHVIIEDELKENKYQDTEDPLTIQFRNGTSEAGLFLEAIKKFDGADFIVRETWEITKDALNWKLEIVLDEGAEDRSLKVRQHFPYYNPPYGMGVWAAHWQYPTDIHRVANNRLAYGDVCFGTLIPAISLYRKEEDVGLTIAKPFGFKTSQLYFHFLDYHSTGIYLETDYLGLRKDRPAETQFMIYPHEGDWRPGLAWLYRKYPEYFKPVNKNVRRCEGGYVMGDPNILERKIKETVDYDPKWSELHGHFIHYGQYAPKDVTEWASGHSTVKPGQPMVGIKKTNDTIALFQKYGIKSLPYFQCAGDGYVPYVEKNFPESIAKDAAGKPMPVWIDCCMMNSDPQTKFGREMLDMVDRFVAMYPNMDGVFVDQLCYDALDTAHDDGVSMYKNKPAYKLWHCYEKPLKKLADIMHKDDKVLYANGPVNVEVQREIDGHMAEGLGWIAGALKYLCIAKPLLFLVYARNAQDLESMFLNCLVAGASYSICFPKKTKDIDRIYKAYVPLVKPLYGREWLLEPDPIHVFEPGVRPQMPFTSFRVSEKMEANIFKGEAGNYIVTLASRQKSILEKDCLARKVGLCVQFRDARKIKSGYSLGTSHSGKRKVKLQREGRKLMLTIPEHFTATTIILEK